MKIDKQSLLLWLRLVLLLLGCQALSFWNTARWNGLPFREVFSSENMLNSLKVDVYVYSAIAAYLVLSAILSFKKSRRG